MDFLRNLAAARMWRWFAQRGEVSPHAWRNVYARTTKIRFAS